MSKGEYKNVHDKKYKQKVVGIVIKVKPLFFSLLASLIHAYGSVHFF